MEKIRALKFQRFNFAFILSIFFVSVFLIPSPAHADYRDTIEIDTPLYYWPMDEAAGATSLTAAVGGTAINLTGATSGAGGQVDGTAVSFNGTSNFGATAASIDLTAYNKVAVEALVYFNNYSTAGTLMGWELSTGIGNTTTGFYFAAKNGDSPNNKFTPAVKGNTGYNYSQYAQASAGAWHHVVAVYDKGQTTNEVSLYVDGQLQTPESSPLTTNNTNNFGNQVLYLMSRAGTSAFTPGKLQHLAIYSSLSSDRILAHAQATGLLTFNAGTLSESSHTSSTATLSWTSSTNGTAPITEQLQRSPSGENSWTNVSSATASPATDTGLSSQTAYDYRVAYTDATPETVYSNTVTITTSKVYPPYTANSDLVVAGPYDTAVSGSPANWGNNLAHTSIDILNIGHKYRIRQNGTISAARLYTVNKTALTGFYITVYRLSGSTYTLVGQSENLVSQLVAGDFATVTFASPITGVQEGDYYGMRVESPSGSAFNFFARTGQTGVSAAYISDQAQSPTSSTWTGGTYSTASGAVMPIELYMQAPQVAFIGDSIISGHNSHLSFLHTTETTNIASTIEKQFSNLTSYNYQNMGIGAQTTSQIEARFTADVINLHPRIAVIEGGVNDLAQSVAKNTFITKWTSMLDAAQASNSITTILVMKILPWSNGTNVQMQTRDDWNSSLATLAAGYSKAVVVDASSYVGQFRAGGDPGNLWDIQTAYNSDGVHFTSSGYGQIAQALADAIDATAPVTTDNTDNSWHNNDITITLSCSDGGTGCSDTYYTTDGTTPTTSSSQGTSVVLSTEGSHTIKYFSVDSVGNQESVKTATNAVKIDKQNPTVSAGDDQNKSASFTQIATASDGGSDINALTYQWAKVSGPGTITFGTANALSTTISADTDGTYIISFTASDNAENSNSDTFSLVWDTAPTTYTITSSAGSHGSINPTGATTINSGDNQSYSITADSGYHISDVVVDGSSVGAVSSYQFSGVTSDHTISATFAVTSSGGGGCYGCYTNPIVPTGGFKISINGGASTTSNRNVFLGFNAGADIKKMAISMAGDFTDASQENYTASKQWDLCSKLGGAIKNPTCPDGKYTVYAKFYTAYGRASDSSVASSSIILNSGSTVVENLQQYTDLPFTKPFTKYMQYRQTNADIKNLQIFLNADPDTKIADTGAGSPGKETNYFGLLTYNAVIKFQEKYAKDILAPWGFKKGTGYVAKTTLAKINELMKNK